MKHVTKGVKAFRKTKDGLFTGGLGGSIETKWTIGETVTLDNDRPLELCGNGFHFFRERDACFGALLFEGETVFYTIEAYGEVLSDTEKCVCRQIKVLAPFELVVDGYRNSGNGNSGYRNSGDRNSGDWNSGDWNSGDWNSGYRNSGDWNSGYGNSGYRNSGYRNSGDWNIFTEISGIEKPD